MKDQHSTFGLAVILIVGGTQAAVKGGKHLHIRTRPGKLQHRCPPEAVAHGHAVIELGAQRSGFFDGANHQGPHFLPVFVELAGMLTLIDHFRGPHSGPEKIGSKNGIALLGQHLSPLDLIIGEAVPVVDQQDEGAVFTTADKISFI